MNHTCQLLVSLFVRCMYSRQKLLIWWHDEGSFAHCWSYILIYILSIIHVSFYPYILSSRTISHWAGWSEAVSHNNGTTQLQLHVEDRKVEQDHDPMIQMIRMFHCCSAQRSGSQLWSSGSRPPVGSVRAGARSLSPVGDQPPHNCHLSYSQDTRAIVLYEDIY